MPGEAELTYSKRRGHGSRSSDKNKFSFGVSFSPSDNQLLHPPCPPARHESRRRFGQESELALYNSHLPPIKSQTVHGCTRGHMQLLKVLTHRKLELRAKIHDRTLILFKRTSCVTPSTSKVIVWRLVLAEFFPS